MVLAERGIQDIRSGRRSRAASPTGHASDGSSTADDSEHSMRVGEDYQAVIPDIISSGPCPDSAPENALLMWSPCKDISDAKLDEYVTVAKEKYCYNVEQALGMLFWHKYDMEKAMADLANFTPYPDNWTVEDKVLFEQAFQFHGKSFHKIRQMLPDKPIASLVKYYYSWKKIRSRTSLMDWQVHKLYAQKDEGSDAGSEAPSENETEMDVDKDNKADSGTKAACSNCSVTTQVFSTPKGSLCSPCCQHLKRTGMLRSNSGAIRTSARHNPIRSKRKPPRGMHLTYDDLVAIVTGVNGEGDAILKSMEVETVSMKRQVQNNKQFVGQLKRKTAPGINSSRPPEGTGRINARWSNDELLLAVQAIRKFGRDWKAVTEVIGTKTEVHVRNFFSNYRRRYNLDDVLKEYDAEHGISTADQEERMDIDRPGASSTNSHPSSPANTSQTVPPLLHPPQSPSNVPVAGNHQRLCPPPLQQANASRNSSGRTLLQQPPPLICPSNTFLNGTA